MLTETSDQPNYQTNQIWHILNLNGEVLGVSGRDMVEDQCPQNRKHGWVVFWNHGFDWS